MTRGSAELLDGNLRDSDFGPPSVPLSGSSPSMKFSSGSLLLGAIAGGILTLFAVDALERMMPTEHLVVTSDLLLCVEGAAECQERGGLAAGTLLEVDPKGFATLIVRVPPPLVAGAVAPRSEVTKPPRLELRRRRP